MPWNAQQMIRKGAKRGAGKAARMANAILAESGNEGMAIAMALKHANKPKAHTRRRLMR